MNSKSIELIEVYETYRNAIRNYRGGDVVCVMGGEFFHKLCAGLWVNDAIALFGTSDIYKIDTVLGHPLIIARQDQNIRVMFLYKPIGSTNDSLS